MVILVMFNVSGELSGGHVAHAGIIQVFGQILRPMQPIQG